MHPDFGEEAACWRNLHQTGLPWFWWLCFSPWERLAWEGDTDFEGGRPGKVFLAYVVIGKGSNGQTNPCGVKSCPNMGEFIQLQRLQVCSGVSQAPDYSENSGKLLLPSPRSNHRSSCSSPADPSLLLSPLRSSHGSSRWRLG